MSGGAAGYLRLDDDALLTQCEVDLYRASGPGGQKRNKTSSAVRLRHQATGLMVTAVEERSQHANRARALRRLRLAIALHVRTPVEVAAGADGAAAQDPPGATVRAALAPDGRIAVGRRDERYLFVVADVLDLMEACGGRVSEVAERVGTSTAHVVKFLQSEPKLWERVNQMRAAGGLKPLRG